MDKNIPILVIGGKGGSVSEGILKSLRLADYSNVSILDYTKESAHIYRAKQFFITDKNPDSGNYLESLTNLVLDNGIKVVIPGSTWEAEPLAEHKEELASKGIHALVNNYNVVHTFNDKWETFKLLSGLGFGTPFTVSPDNDKDILDHGLEYPVIIKPNIGRGSVNVFVAKSAEELKYLGKYLEAQNIEFIVQEHIGSATEEYTVGVLSDSNANVVDSIVMNRKLGGGYSHSARVCERSEVNEYCEAVATKIGSTGPCNIQLRMDDGEPKVFEINPRFSGSAPMRSIAGFNEIDAVLRNVVFGEEMQKPTINHNLRFFRVFQEMYVDDSENVKTGRYKDFI